MTAKGLTFRLSAYIKTQQQLNHLLFLLLGQRAMETFRIKSVQVTII